jgi:hypothetical protein
MGYVRAFWFVGMLGLGVASCGASGGGAAGAVSGAGGQGGITEVTSEPPPCTTEDGANGVLIDPFPYPSPEVSCQALGQPGKLDSKCPSDPFVSCSLDDCVLDSPLPGCCRPDGSCGLLDEARFTAEKSLGCISRDEWIANASWLGGGQVAVACTP